MNRKITDEDIEKIKGLPTLAQILPIKFNNGSIVAGIIAECSGCMCEISSQNTFAKLSRLEHSVAIEGYSLCIPCKIVTPHSLRVRVDGTLLQRTQNGWREDRYADEQKSSLLGLIKALMTGGGE